MVGPQVEATGTEDLASVKQVEIIFSQAAELPAETLAQLPRLQSLTREPGYQVTSGRQPHGSGGARC